MTQSSIDRPTTAEHWRKALADLPATVDDIPAFFFGHGSPALCAPDTMFSRMPGGEAFQKAMGPQSSLASFLRDFGPALLDKYKPKGIAVFSAHWETHDERLVTDYGAANPLLYDYYGFQPEMYKLGFDSRGETALSQRIVQLYKEAGQSARTSPATESRGADGRGYSGPGLDHGVFIPFRLMFGETFKNIPIVQISIDSDFNPERNWAVGKAVRQLRKEGILVLSGGLTIHNLRDLASFSENAATAPYKAFSKAVVDAVSVADPAARRTAMTSLVKHENFRAAQPREDHFVPLYVAAGAGEDGGEVRVISAVFGAPTFAFGVKSG